MNLGLLFTLISGLFFLIGILIYQIFPNKKSLAIFASSSAFVVIFGLIFLDLIPEIVEVGKWWDIFFVLLGLVIFKVIDVLVPHHHHHHVDNDYETNKHQAHLVHISVITILALIFHNLIEGLGLYSLTLANVKSGFLMCLGIGFHNLPLGIQIGSINNSKKNYFLILLLVLSPFLGGILALLFKSIPDVIIGAIMSLTLGMIIHILIFELWGELINNREKMETLYGIIIGIVILVIINIL